jgi:murein DD-endopeptidase MepM/ murein hydrolase activator NlpD
MAFSIRASLALSSLLLSACGQLPFQATTPAPLARASLPPVSPVYRVPADEKPPNIATPIAIVANNLKPLAPVHSAPAHIETRPTPAPVFQAANLPTTCTPGGLWRWPGNGKIQRRLSQTGAHGLHIYAHNGAPVYASASGKVIYSGPEPGVGRHFGHLVIIEHNHAYRSVYAHNQRLRVREGEWVNAGHHIADMGTMLRFEIRCLDKAVDPWPYLPRAS